MKTTITFLTLLLLSVITLNAQVDRTKPPKPAEAPAFNIADYQSFTLQNGLTVFVVENHKLPVLSLQLIVNYDPVAEKPNNGFVEITGSLLRAGTKTKEKAQLDKEIDLIGASLSTSETGLYASSLKKHAAKLFALASEIIITPEFRQAELDKVKEQMISEYQSSKEEPGAIASVVRRKLFYGETHPFGEAVNENSIKSVNLEMVRQFYATYFRPNISYLAIVGDISLSEAKKLTGQYFNQWEKKEVAKVEYRKPAPPLVTKVAIVDRPNAVQSTINIGHPVDLYPGSQDALAAKVTNTILGGGTFRLFNNLREKHGYTYGAYSSLESNRIIGSFNASANVRNAVTDSSVTEFLAEMKRLSDEPVGETELAKVKNYMTGGFAISLESPQTIANFAINTARYNLPADYYKNYLKNLAAVSAADVQKMAKKYILPEQSYVLVVGKAADIADNLKKFTVSGKIDYYDTDGNKLDPNAQKAPEGLTAEKVLDMYVTALGGKENILKVKDLTSNTTGSIQGMQLNSSIYQKVPNKFLAKISIGEMEQSLLFDGVKGYKRSVMGNSEITGSELEEVAFISDLASAVKWSEFGAVPKLTGIQKINGSDAYRIEFKLPKGSTLVEFYDVKSGLKTRQERTVNTPNGPYVQMSDYTNYQEISGVKYPFTITQSIMGRSIELKVTKLDINTGLSDDLFK